MTGEAGPKPSVHRRPLWLGAGLALLVPPACVQLLTWAATLAFSWRDALASFGSTLVFSLPVSLAALALGLPYVVWLRSRGLLRLPWVCLGAAIIGAVVLSLLAGVVFDVTDELGAAAVVGALIGLAAGLAFCLGAGIGMRHLPAR
ncbi:hypothetical protein [Dokdonella koreensis]|uniref:Uncharacterized protein n=1 Tax=Dokdonella koreensis DS-123 TaxID=1300342 RepID=A0A161HIN3_9GAMM|nr:hypothetical protein [Dokdonella koreensis]ANB16260.1 Hypothetical protein I596_221 [Dokdonella koreensis DS-123]